GSDWADVVIWNPDGSTAEMSGNGTRIAARWLAEQTGAERVRIRVVGGREVAGRMLGDGTVEQALGRVDVGVPERVDGIELVAVAAATHDDGEVVVHFPGGDLRVRLEAGRAYLTGPAERVS